MPTMKQLEETAERILRNAMAMAMVGEKALTMNQDQQDLALADLEGVISGYKAMLRECLEQASLEGSNSVHRALHTMPGVDAFMLDEAVEHAPKDGDEK